MYFSIFAMLGAFLAFIFVCKYFITLEQENKIWIKIILLYASCFISFNIWLIYISLGMFIFLRLRKKQELINRKIKIATLSYGLIIFMCFNVLPKYANVLTDYLRSGSETLSKSDQNETADIAVKYYQYLKSGNISGALMLFDNKPIAQKSIIEKLVEPITNEVDFEFKNNISFETKTSVMQKLINNKEYEILGIPTKKDFSNVMKHSPNIFYYYVSFSLKYKGEGRIVGESIYFKKIDGLWKIVNINGNDVFLPYRAWSYDCSGIVIY